MSLREAAKQAVDAIERGETFQYLDDVVSPRLRAAIDASKPLTDEQIDQIVLAWWNPAAVTEILASDHPVIQLAGKNILRSIARAIEKAHGIK